MSIMHYIKHALTSIIPEAACLLMTVVNWIEKDMCILFSWTMHAALFYSSNETNSGIIHICNCNCIYTCPYGWLFILLQKNNLSDIFFLKDW
jgi:hypothetical protein